MGYLGSL